MDSKQTSIYTPDPLLQHPAVMVRNLLVSLGESRELAHRLFIRDLSAQYRQTILGYVWAVLPPLIAAMTFIFLNSQGIVKVDTGGVPYAAFAMMGTLLWQVFVESIMSPSQSVTKSKAMLAKVNFPREAIILSGLYLVFFNLGIRTILLAGVMTYWQVVPGSGLWIFPIALAALILFGLGIGLLLAPLGTLYGDIARGIPIIAQFWMLLTPVVYPARTEGLAGFLAVWNPVSPLIVTARESLTGVGFTALGPFFLVMVCGVILTLVGFVVFRLAMPHLIARLGG